jgi:hypothetical protein
MYPHAVQCEMSVDFAQELVGRDMIIKADVLKSCTDAA